jgi:hypothetical protein
VKELEEQVEQAIVAAATPLETEYPLLHVNADGVVVEDNHFEPPSIAVSVLIPFADAFRSAAVIYHDGMRHEHSIDECMDHVCLASDEFYALVGGAGAVKAFYRQAPAPEPVAAEPEPEPEVPQEPFTGELPPQAPPMVIAAVPEGPVRDPDDPGIPDGWEILDKKGSV